MATYRYRVDIIESEAGWGQKVDDVKFFDDQKSADTYVREFNSRNTAATAPAWYMYAAKPQKVMVDN